MLENIIIFDSNTVLGRQDIIVWSSRCAQRGSIHTAMGRKKRTTETSGGEGIGSAGPTTVIHYYLGTAAVMICQGDNRELILKHVQS